MSGDPRTLATTLRHASEYENRTLRCDASAWFIEQMVPLHDAWLEMERPCMTCGGSGVVGEGRWDHVDGHMLYDPCPDCPDGVLPFDKWTAGLVALWTAVFTNPMGTKPEGHKDCEPCALCLLEYLHSIGGAR